MATIDNQLAEPGIATVTALPSVEQRDELERQWYDVRHLMQLRAEGKPFVTHFKNAELLKSPSSDEWSPASSLMLKYLHRMKSDAEQEIGNRLRAMSLESALNNDNLVHYWGVDRPEFEAMVVDWHGYANQHWSEAKGFLTPAYYLMTHRPPVPFNFERSRLGMISSKLINHIVSGKEWPFPDSGLSQLQPKRAA